MDSKAIIGLIASLGVMGAVITQSSNKAKDAESFMADMTGYREVLPSGSRVITGKGVRKIPPKKLNFTAFDKDLPPFISKKMKQDWDKLASLTPADWQNIGEVSKRGQSIYGEYQRLHEVSDYENINQNQKNIHAKDKFGRPNTSGYTMDYYNVAQTITRSSLLYTHKIEQDALRRSSKKALTAFKKLMANLRKAFPTQFTEGGGYYLSRQDMPKVAKYASFQNFMETVADGAEQLTKIRKSKPFDRQKFNDFMKECKVSGSVAPQQSHLFNRNITAVLQTITNMAHLDGDISTQANQYRYLLDRFTAYPFTEHTNESLPLSNPDVAFQDPARVAYVINHLTPAQLTRMYQYGMFFNDNPIIQFVGTTYRPDKEEVYFSKFASRKNMNLNRVLPKELRLRKMDYVAKLASHARNIIKTVSKTQSEANVLSKIKEDADRMNRETTKKTVIEQVQKALDGGLVSGRFGPQFWTRHSEKSELIEFQKTDLTLHLIENPQSNMASLNIYPSAIIKFYYGGIDENGNPLMEHADTDLMNQRILLQGITGEEVLKGLTLDPSMRALLEASLRHRYDNSIVQNDRQIAQLASQMNQYLERKKSAQEKYDRGLNLIDFAF